MSNLSQFYSTSTSGFIEFEALILSGGGGGGSNGPGGGRVPTPIGPTPFAAGGGGGGAVYYGLISVAPGTTCQVTVGAGGAGSFNGVSPPAIPTLGPYQGSNGGDSTLKTPTFTYRVVGGGGGGGSFAMGQIGGTGGGSHEAYTIYPTISTRPNSFQMAGASSVYSVGGNKHASISNATASWFSPTGFAQPNAFGLRSLDSGIFNSHTSGIFPFKNGFYSGFPGGGVQSVDVIPIPGPTAMFSILRSNSGGGGAGGSSYRGYTLSGPYPGYYSPAPTLVNEANYGGQGFISAIRGNYDSDLYGASELGRGGTGASGIMPVPGFVPTPTTPVGIYTGPANTGNGGSGAGLAYGPGTYAPATQGIPGHPGGSGIVIVSYPTDFAAVPAPNRPGSVDASPATPGRYTYQFPSPGSIKFP